MQVVISLLCAKAHTRLSVIYVGNWSDWVQVTTNSGPDATVPNAPPAIVQVSVTPTSITLNVGSAPAQEGGAQILATLLALVDPEDGVVTVSSGLPPATPESRTLLGLAAATQYTFQSARVNSIGMSQFSTPVVIETAPATPPLVPAAFRQLELWNTHALLRWEEPADGGSRITSYEVELTGVTDPNEPVRSVRVEPPAGAPDGTPAPEFVLLDGLTLTHEYSGRVRAINSVGAGSWTGPVIVYTFLGGQCSGDPVSSGHNDATIWNDNLQSFSAAMASACGGCLGIRSCFLGAWRDLFNPPYSDSVRS